MTNPDVLLDRVFRLRPGDPEPDGVWVTIGDDVSFVPCEHEDGCDH